ncbi:MAG TPA: AGE family epimerase/isomerase [Candidatus Didemnitutus sp.]|nr:AGE family epimerase/isomerase [Candidatus Didemnitutus sp.]
MKLPVIVPLLLLPLGLLAAPAAPTQAELKAYAQQAETELKTDILPWWLKNAPDREHGGFHSFIGEDMQVSDRWPHGALLTTRILWTFSAAYRHYHDPAYLEMAQRAYRDLVDHFVDREHGGLFWSVGSDGQPRDTTKQIYGQVFGIYALAEYFRVTKDQAALDEAIAIFHVVDKYAHDPVNGGYYDTLQRDWTRPKSTKNVLGDAPKSQNSHIHILEGFANLMRVWPDETLRARQKELLELILTRIIDPKTHHLVLFMKDDWTPIGDDFSYGHDIELAWLVVEAADIYGDPAIIARARTAAVEIARVTNAEGVDRDGGVYMEGNAKGPTDPRKEWWEQAEAAVGFLNAYQISRDPEYFADSMRSWRFIEDKFVDRVHGDWHNTLERDGTPILVSTAPNGMKFPEAKLSVWKCPYHNSRACMELIERLEGLEK